MFGCGFEVADDLGVAVLLAERVDGRGRVVALELLANKQWDGAGVLGPEALDAVPFLDLLQGDYGQQVGGMP